MPVKLTKDCVGVHVKAMTDGQLAVITDWSNERSLGQVVQRYGNDLVVVGLAGKCAFVELFTDEEYNDECYCVRIMTDGATLVVADNCD